MWYVLHYIEPDDLVFVVFVKRLVFNQLEGF